MRTFSAAPKADKAASGSDDSIFASADYFKDVKPDEIAKDGLDLANTQSVTPAKTAVDEMMWMDSNDSLGSTMAYAAKDVENLIQGIQTYGFSEALVYYESIIYDLWMFFAETQGIGMGFGVIMTSLLTRAMFAPVIIYGVSREVDSYS